LGRFDLADRSYAAAAKLVGDTPSLLNNEGYSYMLRGDLRRARAKFDAALSLDPGNPTTINSHCSIKVRDSLSALRMGSHVGASTALSEKDRSDESRNGGALPGLRDREVAFRPHIESAAQPS
jgi:hypothetical protein